MVRTPHDACLHRRSRVHMQGTEPKGMVSVDEGRFVEALAANSKGFAAGLDGGLVALFDRDEREGDHLTRMHVHGCVPRHHPTYSSLAISASEEQLALSLAGVPSSRSRLTSRS
jgi:hypothetical protein